MELPLFPIGEVVLLPGMVLPIYVFEPRYRELLGRVRASGEPFGIPCVLPDAPPEARLAKVGSLAHLTEVAYNPDGTALIEVAGGERYRIGSIDGQAYPYAVAEAEPWPLLPSEPTRVSVLAADVVEGFLARVAGRLGDVREHLPDDPLLAASFVAANLRLPGPQAQRVLEAESLLSRYEVLAELLGLERPVLN